MMRRERFKHAEVYYFIGIFCLVMSLILFALSFYVLPHLAFGWRYHVPSFVSLWSTSLQETYQLSEKAVAWFIFLGIFLPALLFAIVADILSNRIERKFHRIEEPNLTPKPRKRVPEEASNFLVMKMIGIIVLVFIAAQFFQWIISSSPQI